MNLKLNKYKLKEIYNDPRNSYLKPNQQK